MKVLSAFSSVGIGETLIHKKNPKIQFTSIEIMPPLSREYKKRFPNSKTIIGNAYEHIYNHFNEYDIIMASPPCQNYSYLNPNKNLEKDNRIFDLITFLKKKHIIFYVENVKSKYLFYNTSNKPTLINRHYFWSNVILIKSIKIPKFPYNFTKATYKRSGLSKTETYIQDLQKWLGVKLSKRFYIRGNHSPGQIYREAIHPILNLNIFEQIISKEFNHTIQSTLI